MAMVPRELSSDDESGIFITITRVLIPLMFRFQCDLHHKADVHPDRLYLAHQCPSLCPPAGQGAEDTVPRLLHRQAQARGGGQQHRHVRGRIAGQSGGQEQQPHGGEDRYGLVK